MTMHWKERTHIMQAKNAASALSHHPFFFEKSDEDLSPDTLKRWRKEHLINAVNAKTEEMRKWFLSQAARCDLVLISRGLVEPVPAGLVVSKAMGEALEEGLKDPNEPPRTPDEEEAAIYSYLAIADAQKNPMSEAPTEVVENENIGVELYTPKIVNTQAFGPPRAPINGAMSTFPPDRLIPYDCGCAYNPAQARWEFHCQAFKNGFCPVVAHLKAKEEARKQSVGNNITDCPCCLKSGGIVKMEYQSITQWKCPVCGHWENIDPSELQSAVPALTIEDQPACGCLWPLASCDKCRTAYRAWWSRQVEAGLVNETENPLGSLSAREAVNKKLAQLEAQGEAEQSVRPPFDGNLTDRDLAVLQREKERLTGLTSNLAPLSQRDENGSTFLSMADLRSSF